MSQIMTSPRFSRLRTFTVVSVMLSGCAFAVEGDFRITPQLMVGTAGFEPGLALEYRAPASPNIVFRPELFLSEDERLGGGGAVLFAPHFDLPSGQELCFGPRFVYHNSDDTGYEADALATYSVAIGGMQPNARHFVGGLAALGLRDDRHHDDDYDDGHHHHDLAIGASVGAFYSYRF